MLGKTRSPLEVINDRINVTVDDQNIFPTIIFVIVLGGLLVVFANKKPLTANFERTEMTVVAESPKQLYVSNCARCHGADGKGNTQLGQDLGTPDLTITARRMSLTRVKNVIKNGDGEMPAYNKKLTTAQIAQVAAYVRKLR